MKKSNFNKFPQIFISGHTATVGWEAITETIMDKIQSGSRPKTVVVLDTYHGVYLDEILAHLKIGQTAASTFDVSTAFLDSEQLEKRVYPFITDDPVFGYVTTLELSSFFDPEKAENLRKEIAASKEKVILVAGTGASIVVPDADILLYADMPRWEIQLRFRNNKISNLATENAGNTFSYQYKRSFFVDWKVCDRHKQALMDRWILSWIPQYRSIRK